MSTQREQFEAWRSKTYAAHDPLREHLWSAWQARDEEVRELVEALRELYWIPPESRERIDALLAKHQE